jgi:eukaryotic-like serine/threonine-protein kinase
MTTPQVLGERYEIGGVLGRGGMAEVHRGRDLRLGREVAVKVLRSDLARDPSFQVRFRREAQAAASLNHPAIVAVYDTGEDRTANGATPYIVMEYVEGDTLRDVLRREGPLDPERAMSLTADICGALDFSHRNGIVHRDVKPGNVMLTPQGAVKVMDFGIARAVSDSAATMTSTAAVIGTAQYLSPEQARGEAVDARSDVYSVGCMLYELVTGAPPFTGDSPVSVAYQHVREDPRLPSSINPAVPPALDAILLKAMSKNPANRYQSAAEMRNDLLRAIAGQRVEATPVMGDVEKTTLLGAAPAGYGYDDGDRWDDGDADAGRQQRRRRLVVIGSVVALLVVLGGVLAAVLLNHGSATPTAAATVAVPNVVNQDQNTATQTLQAAGFTVTTTQVASTAQQKGLVVSTSPAGGAQLAKGAAVQLSIGSGPDALSVPDVTGKTAAAASAALKQAGFTGNINTEQTDSLTTKGRVVSSDPAAGAQAAPGATITLQVSTGTIAMPDVRNQTEAQARQALVAAGFSAGQINSTTVERDDVPQGRVAGTDPDPGTPVGPGETVNLQIAAPTPPDTTTAPATSTSTPPGSDTASPPPAAPGSDGNSAGNSAGNSTGTSAGG